MAGPADYPIVPSPPTGSASPYTAARQAYAEASVLTAPPDRLVVMLYDGVLRFLAQGAAAMRGGDRALARARLRRAEAVIDELNVSLDLGQGEVAERLRGIYLFCKRHLVEAVLEQDPARIDDVARLLGELREAWARVAAEPAASGA